MQRNKVNMMVKKGIKKRKGYSPILSAKDFFIAGG
jgi:hypothetical protein